MLDKENKNSVDYSVSPLLDTTFLQAAIEVDQEDVNEQLNSAVTTEDYMDVLSGLHKVQVRKALRNKKTAKSEPIDNSAEVEEENEPTEVEEVEEEKPAEINETKEVEEENEESFKPFPSFEKYKEKESDSKISNDEDLFGDLFGENSSKEFGGISLDMLEGKNKMEAAEALSAEEFKANDGVIDPNGQGGYIDKSDYQTGRQYSKENMKKADDKPYLTEEDGLFNPENADQSQIVLSGASASTSKDEELNSPLESGEKPAKYKVKKNQAGETYGETGGRGVAWLAYILFFIPMLFAGKKSFVRHHANQGFVINIFDIIAGILIALKYLPLGLNGEMIELIITISFAVGGAIEIILLFVRVAMMIFSFFGKTPQLPVFGKIKIFKIQ